MLRFYSRKVIVQNSKLAFKFFKSLGRNQTTFCFNITKTDLEGSIKTTDCIITVTMRGSHCRREMIY